MTLFTKDSALRPLDRLLIANRGEIAVRIIRACRDEGIESIAVYADSDRDAPFVGMADRAYALGGDRPADSYLDANRIIAAATRAGADAIHPGYGFLSEQAAFAAAVEAAGMLWIGPPPQVIAALGDKVEARRIASAVGAPLVAGTPGPVATSAEALAFAREHGLPIAIKAAFGGGGRGLKVARRLDEVDDLFAAATREATAAFGRGECFVERFLDHPRHIEAQILADEHGTVKVLGTRDCSLQRRHQKLVEEAPAPFLTDAQRTRVHAASRAICAKAGYTGAGTVEFLLAADGSLAFLEVNTRLQVEHPVTEETTGIDIVRAMIRIARGAQLTDEFVPPAHGHAIEFRINAEDPARGFLPTPGEIRRFDQPAGPGIRVDSGVAGGTVVPAQFDSLIAKLIVTGATRAEALARAARALAEFRVEGVATVLPFARALLAAPEFRAEDGVFGVHTGWIESGFAERLTQAVAPHPRVTPVEAAAMTSVAVEIDGRRHTLTLPTALLAIAAAAKGPPPTADAGDAENVEIRAPVAGVLAAWRIADGEVIAPGDVVAVIEAMKMETPVVATRAGRLMHRERPGATLAAGTPIAHIVDAGS